MPRKDRRPPQPTRVMVLAGLMLFHSVFLFFVAAKNIGPVDADWPLDGILDQGTYGGVVLLASWAELVLAFLLMANTLIGRWLAVGYAALTSLGLLVLLVTLSLAYQPILPAPVMVPFLVLIIGAATLTIWMAYPRPDERRRHREAQAGASRPPAKGPDAAGRFDRPEANPLPPDN